MDTLHYIISMSLYITLNHIFICMSLFITLNHIFMKQKHVVIGSTDIFLEFDRLLQLILINPITLYYNTIFCLGDFYVSTLAFQHIMFEENPVILLAPMVHEHKFQKCHDQLFEIIIDRIPRLGRKAIPIITDREAGTVNVFQMHTF